MFNIWLFILENRHGAKVLSHVFCIKNCFANTFYPLLHSLKILNDCEALNGLKSAQLPIGEFV